MTSITLSNLRTEYVENPLGLETPQLRFSWQLNHLQRGQLATAFQVLAASKPELLQRDLGDLWDSGKLSPGEFPVTYAGVPLISRQRCWWKTRAWDKDGEMGPYSEPAWFEMGLLQPRDWQAEWVGFPAGWNGKALYFRRPFLVDKPVAHARIYICGLGYYELRLNGKKVGENVLDPAPTAYDRRALYCVYDVGEFLQRGENVAGVIVGNGWYGSPRMIFQMEIYYQDGTTQMVVSGRSGPGVVPWQVGDGAIQENGIYQGEVYDARMEIPGWDEPGTPVEILRRREWASVSVVEGPGGRLQTSTTNPMRGRNAQTGIDQPA
jgi:alpha-L-rhamnosidase